VAVKTVGLDRHEQARRPDVEHDLNEKYHVQWDFLSNVSPSMFDVDKSLHNQARFEPLDPKTVAEYADAVTRGDIFPAVVAYRPGKSRKLVVIDGNHRLAAHQKGGRALAVYELDPETDPRTIALLTFALNTRHGRPTMEAERIAQAIYLVDNGASQDHAAAAVNLSPRILKRALTRQSSDRRADEVGLKRNEWDTLAAAVKSRLVNVATDEGFRAAAELAYAARLDAAEAFQLVGLVNSTKSGARQAEIVAQQRDQYRDRIQDSGGGVLGTADRRTQGPKQRVALALGQITALPEDDEMILRSFAAPERETAAKRMRDAGERLVRLAGRLEA
jgi:hypothetical protein